MAASAFGGGTRRRRDEEVSERMEYRLGRDGCLETLRKGGGGMVKETMKDLFGISRLCLFLPFLGFVRSVGKFHWEGDFVFGMITLE